MLRIVRLSRDGDEERLVARSKTRVEDIVEGATLGLRKLVVDDNAGEVAVLRTSFSRDGAVDRAGPRSHNRLSRWHQLHGIEESRVLFNKLLDELVDDRRLI